MKNRGDITFGVAAVLGALLLTLAPANRTYSQNVASTSCQDMTQDCKKPKYLGPKGSCACFACKKNRADEDLRVVCTSKAEEKAALFEAEDRADPTMKFYSNALVKSASVEEFKASIRIFNLDPYDASPPAAYAGVDFNRKWQDDPNRTFPTDALNYYYEPGRTFAYESKQNFLPRHGLAYSFNPNLNGSYRNPYTFDLVLPSRVEQFSFQIPRASQFSLPAYRNRPNPQAQFEEKFRF